jgi:hypothetical protein
MASVYLAHTRGTGEGRDVHESGEQSLTFWADPVFGVLDDDVLAGIDAVQLAKNHPAVTDGDSGNSAHQALYSLLDSVACGKHTEHLAHAAHLCVLSITTDNSNPRTSHLTL